MSEERYRRILESTKSLFLEELRVKSADIADTIERWRLGSVADDRLVDHLYRQTHTLKGVALTVGFADVHDIADAVSEFKHRHEESPLPKEELDRLAERAMKLEIYR
ncbi:Hpt domain-containing protein [Paenibacillus antri]|nr:Hpt domain-containing protein [Paenibacillus antri]